MPSQIVILRHAEKPRDDGDASLSDRGRYRAAALAAYLPDAFGPFDRLLACKDSKESHRPRETLEPLARALRLSLDTSYENERFEELARHLLGQVLPASVVVCWHHGTIPQLARALGADDVPGDWDDDVFDRVWRLVPAGGRMKLDRVHQQLMFGDSDG